MDGNRIHQACICFVFWNFYKRFFSHGDFASNNLVSALKTTKRYLFLFSDLLLITEFKSETKRFIALEVGKEFKVNRNRSDLHDRYGKKLNFTLANSFWTKCFFLQCVNWWKSVDFAQEDENGEPKYVATVQKFYIMAQKFKKKIGYLKPSIT